MADEAKLAAEIARLEAELERARLESKKEHLKAELHMVEGVLSDDEIMVIKDLIDDTGDDEEYVEYTETSYEEYDEEEVIEYEEGEFEEEEYEEVIEEEDVAPVVSRRDVPEQAPSRSAIPIQSQLQMAQSKLRKIPLSSLQKKEKEAAEAARTPPPAPPSEPGDKPATRPKKIVRPPPSKGGKPIPRKDPEKKPKSTMRHPLSRLLQRNKKSVEAKEDQSPAPAAAAPAPATTPVPQQPAKKAVVKKAVKKRVAKKTETTQKTTTPTAGGSFQRRVIPNLQPSPAGEETMFEKLLGPKLITNPKLHKCSTKGCFSDQDLICLYFGAVWKTECKRFNANLKDFYYNVSQQNNLEVVYISADRSLLEFKDCYLTMPFLAMPAGTTELKNELTQILKIIEMPALVVLDDEGDVVTVEGVRLINELEKGNVKQANDLVARWKKTRPIPMEQVQKDRTLLHGTIERGTVYWHK